MFVILRRVGFVSALAVGMVATAASAVEPFTEEAVARGLVYEVQPYPQPFGNEGSGCGFADLDNDGDPDAIILGAVTGSIGIFENDGTGNFINRSFVNGVPLIPLASGFAAADYDGDGDLDLYITVWTAANVLLRNQGSFQFINVTAAAGVGDAGEGEAASFGDYDGDGWLDLYLCNYTGLVLDPPAPKNVLYRNLGNGAFEDVSVEQGVDDEGYGFQSVWFDYDRDGDVDLYLSNDRGHLPPLFANNQLWRNDNGNLVNVSAGSGADLGLFSMGVACGDFDGNRWPDLYCTNIAGYIDGFNPLFLNQGDGTFVESSEPAGVDLWVTSWGAIFFDFDNDGRQDLYVNTQFASNALFHNDGGFPCAEITLEAGVAGSVGTCPLPGDCNASFSSAIADVDSDGDLDLLMNNLGTNVELYINHEGDLRNSIRFQLVGQAPNHFGVGARVDVRFGSVWQFQEVLAGGNGYLGQNELTLHFGADQAGTADEVLVSWPGGKTTRTLTNMPVGHTWQLFPPEDLGNADGNNTIDLADFGVMSACYGAAVQPGCEVMDLDGDGTIGMSDFEAFLKIYDGPLYDCDGNLQFDLLDIILDTGLDADGSGIPDGCEAGGDLTGNGVVNAADLALLLGAWGACDCPADITGNNIVNAADLAIVLGGWTS